MDTDNSPQTDNNNINASNDVGEDQNFSASEKVFDITSDMDIKPLQENEGDEYNNAPQIPAQNVKIPQKPAEPTFKNVSANTVPINNVIKEPTPSIKTMYTAEEKAFAQEQPVTKTPDNTNYFAKKLEEVEKKTQNNTHDPFIKPIRTYEGDVAELLSRKKTSTVAMVMAENRRETGTDSIGNNDSLEQTSSGTWKKMLLVILSLIFILAGVGGAYYLFLKSPLAPATPAITVQKITSVIPNDAQVFIAIDNLTPKDIQNKIKNEASKNQEVGTIKEIVLTKTENNIKSRVSGPEILSIMDITPPDVLERSLADDWMLGVYVDENSQSDIFVIFTNNFFQNAFAGMLQWEGVMADDIKQYLYQSTPAMMVQNYEDTTASSSTDETSDTASSSEPRVEPPNTLKVNTNFTIRGAFEDRIVKNKDERAFRTYDGNILFLYSFIDNKKLVITSKESTLSEILNRVEKEGFVR